MFNYGNLKLFFTKSIFGLIFLSISTFLFLSLISFDPSDPGFGSINNNAPINNFAGMVGSYTSGVFFVFIGSCSYVIPLFFLIHGIKFLLGIKNYLIAIKFFSFILGVGFLTLVINMYGGNGGVLGYLSLNILNHYFDQYLTAGISYWLLVLILFLISFCLLLLGVGTYKINLIKKYLYYLRYVKLIILPLTFVFKFYNRPKTIYTKKVKLSKNKIFKKTEPTIVKKTTLRKKEDSETIVYNKSDLKYALPPISLLKTSNEKTKLSREIEKSSSIFAKRLEVILAEYGVEGEIVNFKYGPIVTLYEFLPAAGIKTSKVVGLSADIARAMSSISTRISSQPGKTSIGIEIPNDKREEVLLGDLIKSNNFSSAGDGLIIALGKNISGEKKFTDLEKMPHLLIAGTTGSGKSVGINAMIISLLYRFTPSECKLILIDPKMLELSIYEDIPHLLTPVVTDPNKAVFALKWVVREMENRYKLMSSLNVKNIKSFNSKITSTLSSGRKLYREVQTGIDSDSRMPIMEKKEIPLDKMPLIVVVIDEMADLMMVAGKEVENLVQRLAQMARASGIHLIAATQRPSVDVITGTIKANFPSRISFRVASRFDSRTILNEMGAEQLLGSGDMLFLENGASLTRLHGGYVSENEIEEIVKHIKNQSSFNSPKDITLEENNLNNLPDLGFNNKEVDELYEKALSIIIEQQKVSTSFIQRYLQIGYNRAARIVEKMEEDGYISEPSHSGKRSVLKKNK